MSFSATEDLTTNDLAGNGQFLGALANQFRLGEEDCPWVIYGYETVSSTMDAAARIESGALSLVDRAARVRGPSSLAGLVSDRPAGFKPILVLAQSQTSGRGRESRVWHSPAQAGIYLTYLWPGQIVSSGLGVSLSGFSLAMGVAVRRFAEDLGVALKLKWPNDVVALDQGRIRKLAGVLTEASSSGSKLRFISVGIGLNLNQSEFPEEIPGVSLSQLLGSELNYFAAVAGLSKQIEHVANSFFAGGFGQFVQEWNSYSAINGARINVIEKLAASESCQWMGTAVECANDGGLIVSPDSDPDQRRVVYSGEISI